MGEIIYTTDTSIDKDVPPIMSYGTFLPYEGLISRHFEILVFLTYKNEIEYGNWNGLYDGISLMQGVKDSGRDCALTKNGKNSGLIQCKNYTSVLAKGDCVKELIKFLIHYTTDNSLIEDVQKFTYYIIAPKGLKNEATELINDFSNRILAETELNNWIKQVYTNNKSFSSLSLAQLQTDLKPILGAIKVRQVEGAEIDLLLKKPANLPIKKLFFSFPGEEQMDEILEEIRSLKKSTVQSASSAASITDILNNIETASHSLFQYGNTFSSVAEIHLERAVTEQIYQWLITPLQTNDRIWNLALLCGDAGAGKSVVMRDLCDKLRANHIPVLGIKADMYQAGDVTSLQNKLNLSDPVDSLAKKLGERHALVVVCIDQIDALSQSLSANRDYITTFNSLISSLRLLDNVRVIISTRSYDLAYDPSLKYYEKQKIFKLEKMTAEEVSGILAKEKIPVQQLSASLLELLRNPNELNVFLRIYRPNSKLETFQSIYDLYTELWRQKVLNTETRNLLFDIAAKMYGQQTINIPETAIQDHDIKIIDYAKSAQLIESGDHRIQFFHQTFYDYVFAKYFSSGDQHVEDYITANNNSLFIRSSVKMILSFQSGVNHIQYIGTASNILFSEHYSFHIRLLVIQILGRSLYPTPAEKKLVKEIHLNHPSLFMLFIESVNSAEWLSFLIKEGYTDKLFSDTADLNLPYQLLTRHFPVHRKIVLEYLESMPAFSARNEFRFKVMLQLNQFDSEPGFRMVTQYKAELKTDYYTYLMIAEHALPYNPTWAIDLIMEYVRENIISPMLPAGNSNALHHYQHEIGSLFQKIINTDPVTAFNRGLEIAQLCIDETSYEHIYKHGCFFSDRFFEDIDEDENHIDGYQKIYFLLNKLTGTIALNNTDLFKTFFEQNKNSNSISLLHLVFTGLQTNPAELVAETVEFFGILFEKNLMLEYAPRIDSDLKQLISISYPHLPVAFKQKISHRILSISPAGEIGYRDQQGKKVFQGGQGYGNLQYSFLRCIPEKQRLLFPLINKRFQELQRKFPDYREQRKGFYFSGSKDDISATKLKHFTLEAWVNIFKSRKNSSTQLARSFKEEVKLDTTRFYPIVAQLVKDENIRAEYIINGTEGLIDAKFDAQKVWAVVKQLIKRQLERFDMLNTIWLCQYFRKNDITDNEMFEFLLEALNHTDPEEEKDATVQTGINTVRGAAIHELILFCTHKPWQKQIIAAAQKAANDRVSSVRASCLQHLAYLTNADKEATLQIFLSIVKDNNDFLETGMWSVKYLSHYNFNAVLPFLEKAIDVEVKVMESAVAILCHRFAQGLDGSEQLLERAFVKSAQAKSIAIHTAQYNMIDEAGNLQEKYATLYRRFFKEPEDSAIGQAYGNSFLHLQPANFKTLFPLLRDFVLLSYGQQTVSYFYEYLQNASRFYPAECIDLLLLIEDFNKIQVNMRVSKDNPINVVINSYNRLYQQDPDAPKTKIALDLFNKLLELPQYRKELDTILEKVEK